MTLELFQNKILRGWTTALWKYPPPPGQQAPSGGPPPGQNAIEPIINACKYPLWTPQPAPDTPYPWQPPPPGQKMAAVSAQGFFWDSP